MVSVKGEKCFFFFFFLENEHREVNAGEIMCPGTVPGLFMLLTKGPREKRKLPVPDPLNDGYKESQRWRVNAGFHTALTRHSP